MLELVKGTDDWHLFGAATNILLGGLNSFSINIYFGAISILMGAIVAIIVVGKGAKR